MDLLSILAHFSPNAVKLYEVYGPNNWPHFSAMALKIPELISITFDHEDASPLRTFQIQLF